MTHRSASKLLVPLAALAVCSAGVGWNSAAGDSTPGPAPQAQADQNWSQWLGSPQRNNTPAGVNIPTEWNVGEFDYRTGAWDKTDAKNIKWVSPLGSRSYGSAVVHNGKVFMGSNNTAAHLERFPAEVDLGCL